MIGNTAHKKLLDMVNTRTLYEGDKVIITFPRRDDKQYTGVVTHDLPKLKKVSIKLDNDLRTMQAYWNGCLWAENVKLGEENVKVITDIKTITSIHDNKIKEMEQTINDLKTKLTCVKNDYWFMINLIERYSSDKDQTLKDCLERMKFRKPLFQSLGSTWED